VRPCPGALARRAIGAGLVTAALSIGACGPRPVRAPALPISEVYERYRVALEARERRSAAVESDIAVWVRLPDRGRLPGVQAALWMAAPGAARLRVGSTFGTALDLAARGDSVTLYVPSRRAYAQADANTDSLGVREPGAWMVRAWCGTWRAGAAAFDAGALEGAPHVARWMERGDSLTLAVDAAGLPAWLRVRRAGSELRVDYPEWGAWDGVRWPARIEVSEGDGGFHLTCRVQRVRFPARAEPGRMAVRMPADAERHEWWELRRALER